MARRVASIVHVGNGGACTVLGGGMPIREPKVRSGRTATASAGTRTIGLGLSKQGGELGAAQRFRINSASLGAQMQSCVC